MAEIADRKWLGILLALASYALYTLHYATMKWLGGDYSLWQLIFLRSAAMLAITLVLGRKATLRAFAASPHKLPTAIRGALQFLSALCFYKAANALPLADVTTLYSTAPLIIVVFSMLLLKEKVGFAHGLAVALGLVGTVVAAGPSIDTAGLPVLYALGSALFWALTVVLTRKSGARESTDVQLFTTSLVFLVLSLGFLEWRSPVSVVDLALMAAIGLQIYLAQLCFFEACRFAPASVVGPMEYSSLVWAALFGYLLFADIPTIPVFAGAALVIVAGLLLTLGLPSNRKPSAMAAKTEALDAEA